MMITAKKILVNFVLIIIGLVFGLVLIEVGIRAFDLYRFPAHDFFEPHAELGWSHIPNQEGYWRVGTERISVKINSKGLRDREFVYEKQKETFRILVLGDSFTQALQVPLEDTFSKILESKLNNAQGNYEVINAGFPGVGTDYQALFFRREGYKYRPDLVIVAFFLNDVFDNYRSRDILDDEGAPSAYEKRGLAVSLKQFLAERSCAYNYFGYVVPAHMPTFSKILMKLGLLSPQPIDSGQGTDQYRVFSKEYGPEWQKAWEVTRTLILELDTEARKYGSNLVIVSIPFREQADKALWNELLRPGDGEREWDANKPDRILSEFLNDAGIPFLPLLHDFRKAAGQSELYHPADGHWNRNGHRLAAELIHEWLVEEGLVSVKDEDYGVRAKG